MKPIAYYVWIALASWAHWRWQCALDELDDIERYPSPALGFSARLMEQADELRRLWLRYEHRAAMSLNRSRRPACRRS